MYSNVQASCTVAYKYQSIPRETQRGLRKRGVVGGNAIRPYRLPANRFNDSLEGIYTYKNRSQHRITGPTAISKHNSIMKYKNSL